MITHSYINLLTVDDKQETTNLYPNSLKRSIYFANAIVPDCSIRVYQSLWNLLTSKGLYMAQEFCPLCKHYAQYYNCYLYHERNWR